MFVCFKDTFFFVAARLCSCLSNVVL